MNKLFPYMLSFGLLFGGCNKKYEQTFKHVDALMNASAKITYVIKENVISERSQDHAESHDRIIPYYSLVSLEVGIFDAEYAQTQCSAEFERGFVKNVDFSVYPSPSGASPFRYIQPEKLEEIADSLLKTIPTPPVRIENIHW